MPKSLTRAERERITDSRLKVQSVSKALQHVDPAKIPDFAEIDECLKDADKSLGQALQSPPPNPAQN